MEFDKWFLRSMKNGDISFICDMTTFVEKINNVFLLYQYKGVKGKTFYHWTYSLEEAVEIAYRKI